MAELKVKDGKYILFLVRATQSYGKGLGTVRGEVLGAIIQSPTLSNVEKRPTCQSVAINPGINGCAFERYNSLTD